MPRRRVLRLAAVVAAAGAGLAAVVLLTRGGDDPRAFREPAGIVDVAARVEKAVPAAMRGAHVPGAAVAIVRSGRIAWTRGFGIARAGGRARVTPRTRFQVGSLSKPVTAWGLLRTHPVPLGRPLADELSPWPLRRSRSDDVDAITPRRLLSHTAGLSVGGYLGLAPGTPLPSTLVSLQGRGPDGAATAVRQVQRPGTGWRYSGGGYTLLQYAIERGAERPFARWARAAVLDPLAMRTAAFGQPIPGHDAIATGHDADGRPLPAYHYAELAAAGLIASATDMGRFAAALLRREDATVRAMATPQPATDGHWGLGIAVSRLADGTHVLSHEGVNRGWHARLLAYPGRAWAAVVLTNGDGGGAVADAVQRQFEH
jgi:CubicO group peptidase (beta-lactamase class C family)